MKRICTLALCLLLVAIAVSCTRANRDSRVVPQNPDHTTTAPPTTTLPAPGLDNPGSQATMPPPGSTTPHGYAPSYDGPPFQADGLIDPFAEAARLESPYSRDNGHNDMFPPPSQTTGEMPVAVHDEQNAPASVGEHKDAPVSTTDTGGVLFVPMDDDIASFERELLRLINELRAENGVHPLEIEWDMHFAARIRAPEVVLSLSHTRPDGTPYHTAMDEAGYTYAGKWHGENVSKMRFAPGAYTAKEAAAKMFDALKESSGHSQNMLSVNFNYTGIGAHMQLIDDMIHAASSQLFSS